MAHAKVLRSLSFSAHRKLLEIKYNDDRFLLAFGFDAGEAPIGCTLVETNAAHLIVALDESAVRPIASPLQIGNIVEVSDLYQNPNYLGHEFAAVASLFPNLKTFKIYKPIENIWAVFFSYCLEEIDSLGTWIELPLRETLNTILNLNQDLASYELMAKSVLDGDPRSFFLSLYRCLEAFYAYASSVKLKTRLGIDNPWEDVAVVLERV